MPYQLLEDTTPDDIVFQAWGTSLEDTFKSSAEAILKVMVENPEQVREKIRREVNLENKKLDQLLFDFLQQLINCKDIDKLLLHVLKARIEETPNGYRLSATVAGEGLDPQRHRMQKDIKRVMPHRFYLKIKDKEWTAQVILGKGKFTKSHHK